MRLKVRKSTLRAYVELLFAIILSGLILFLTRNPAYGVLALGVLVVGAISAVRGDLSHPYSWFSATFFLYSIGYPVLYMYGLNYDVYLLTKSLFFSQWLALVVFLVTVSPSKIDYKEIRSRQTRMVSSKPIMVLAAFAVILAIADIIRGGYTHKREIYASGSTVVSLGFRVALVFIAMYGYNAIVFGLAKGKIDRKLTVFSFALITLTVLFSGERDLLLRLVVVLFFVYYIVVADRHLDKDVILLGVGGLTLIPILKKYKYFGLTRQTTHMYGFFLIDLFTSEFASASKNLQIILLDDTAHGLFGGMTWLHAVLRALNLDLFLNYKPFSSVQWFNQTNFAAGRAGQGFSLVADGYVNYGYFGIVALFAMLGLLVGYVYRRSGKSVFRLLFYVLSVPTLMYSIRADLANIVSPMLNQNLVTIMGLYVFVELVKSKNEVVPERALPESQ